MLVMRLVKRVCLESNQMHHLFFLIGLPRSGKTSTVHRWLNYDIDICNNNTIDRSGNKFEFPSRVTVCADDIRLSMGHRWNGFVEDYVHATKIMMIRTLLHKHDVLVDGTHTTAKSIKQLLAIDKNAQYYIVNTPPEECKKRATVTNQEDLHPIIDSMNEQLWRLADFHTKPRHDHLLRCHMDVINKKVGKWREQVFIPRISD